jgi:hypothetical protein
MLRRFMWVIKYFRLRVLSIRTLDFFQRHFSYLNASPVPRQVLTITLTYIFLTFKPQGRCFV